MLQLPFLLTYSVASGDFEPGYPSASTPPETLEFSSHSKLRIHTHFLSWNLRIKISIQTRGQFGSLFILLLCVGVVLNTRPHKSRDSVPLTCPFQETRLPSVALLLPHLLPLHNRTRPFTLFVLFVLFYGFICSMPT